MYYFLFSNEVKQINLMKIFTHPLILVICLCSRLSSVQTVQCLFLDRVSGDDHGHIHSEAGQEVLHSGHHNQ